jgi:hypothetical protein
VNSEYTDDGACLHCGEREMPVDDLVNYRGVDPCLGRLEGVTQACCGHGGLVNPYVTIAPGNAPGTMTSACVPGSRERVLYGVEALDYFRSRGVGPA